MILRIIGIFLCGTSSREKCVNLAHKFLVAQLLFKNVMDGSHNELKNEYGLHRRIFIIELKFEKS